MLAAWAHQPIGDQHESPIAQPHHVPPLAPLAFIEHGVEAEFTPYRTNSQHRAPNSTLRSPRCPRVWRNRSCSPCSRHCNFVKSRCAASRSLRPIIEDRAVLGFARLVAIGFDDAYVFALEAIADGCPHNPQEHGRGGSESGNLSLQR